MRTLINLGCQFVAMGAVGSRVLIDNTALQPL